MGPFNLMNLNALYQEYHTTKSNESYVALFKGLRQLSKYLCNHLFRESKLGSLEDAWEDAATHCALQVWEGKYDPTAKFETWARSVIRNKLIDWARNSQDDYIAGSIDDPDMEGVIPYAPSPLAQILKREAIESLTDIERQVLSLRMNQHSLEDIARELNLSLSTVNRVIRELKGKSVK